jgi:hypothetical protein
MKRTLLFAALVAVAAASPAPAWANGEASGTTFSIEVQDFPDHAYRGAAVSGTLSITLDGITGAARMAQVVTYVDTPLGRAVLSQTPINLGAGETRVVRMRCDVDADAATGPLTFGVQVVVGDEVLRVEHEVYIVGGK